MTTTKATRDLSTVDVSARDDGSYGVLSSSGETIYTVTLSAEGNTCTCPAGQNGRHCYHVAACCQRSAPAMPVPATCERTNGAGTVCGLPGRTHDTGKWLCRNHDDEYHGYDVFAAAAGENPYPIRACEGCGEPGAEQQTVWYYVGGRGYMTFKKLFCSDSVACLGRVRRALEAR